jgi:GNAT superfamily N-acetyltransferase
MESPAFFGNPFKLQQDFHILSYKDLPTPALEAKPVLEFLNKELRPKARFSIEQEYPSLFKDLPGGESLFIKREGNIVSHVGTLVREYRYNELRFKVGLIGSVATNFHHRGSGLASLLLKEAVNRLKSHGCVIAVLWSDKPDFYSPLGFYRAGQEKDFQFSMESVFEPTELSREGVSEIEVHKLWRLYQKHSGRVDRSLEEMKALLGIPNTRVFVTERSGEITSYLVINKGNDFTGYIHEWGGDLPSLVSNIGYCQKNIFKEQKLTLIAPFQGNKGVLSEIAEREWDGSLGLIKILDRPKLIACYREFVAQNKIEYPKRDFTQATDLECIHWIFGKEGENSPSVLPFFLWGFDSV